MYFKITKMNLKMKDIKDERWEMIEVYAYYL